MTTKSEQGLTVGKVYDAKEGKDDQMFFIQENDDGEFVGYWKEYFTKIITTADMYVHRVIIRDE